MGTIIKLIIAAEDTIKAKNLLYKYGLFELFFTKNGSDQNCLDIAFSIYEEGDRKSSAIVFSRLFKLLDNANALKLFKLWMMEHPEYSKVFFKVF